MGLFADELATDIAREADDNNATRADYERALDIVFGPATPIKVADNAADTSRSIFTIAAEQGWNTLKLAEVMGGFIAESGNLDTLSDYAEAVAKRQNGE